MTYVISIDYMTDAEKLWSKARGAYELYPERYEAYAFCVLNERSAIS
ncbi:MAG: hypothetical protein QXH37_05360 [Candidatus Bathyarchaeia archaeon]